MPVRIILGMAITVLGFGVAGSAVSLALQAHPFGQAGPGPDPGQHQSAGRRPRSPRWPGSASCCNGRSPALAHFFTMWGFTILLLTIIEAYGALFQKDFHFPRHRDLGLGRVRRGLLRRRGAGGAGRLHRHPAQERPGSAASASPASTGPTPARPGSSSAMIAAVMITLLLYRAAQINTVPRLPLRLVGVRLPRRRQAAAPAGHRASTACSSTVFLILNVAVISGFLVFVSYSKHLHIFLAPINVAFSRRPRALGALDKTPDMDMENVDEDTVFGVGQVGHFTWKQMLDFATCTECGRCQSACPAWNTGKPLSPKLLIMGLRDNMFASRRAR